MIHLAFDHDFEKGGWEKSMAEESDAVEAYGAALEGIGKALVLAAGTPGTPGRASTEEDPALTVRPLGSRS